MPVPILRLLTGQMRVLGSVEIGTIILLQECLRGTALMRFTTELTGLEKSGLRESRFATVVHHTDRKIRIACLSDSSLPHQSDLRPTRCQHSVAERINTTDAPLR